MAEVTEIVNKLLERTEDGKVSWKTTADENTFAAVVGNMSTLVLGYRDPLRRQMVQLRILNNEGREIETWDTGRASEPEILEKLVDLYAKARRSALGVDKQLDELLKALEG